jgi:hypothetical protein
MCAATKSYFSAAGAHVMLRKCPPETDRTIAFCLLTKIERAGCEWVFVSLSQCRSKTEAEFRKMLTDVLE